MIAEQRDFVQKVAASNYDEAIKKLETKNTFTSFPLDAGENGGPTKAVGLNAEEFKDLFTRHKQHLETRSLATVAAAKAYKAIREAIDSSSQLTKADLKVASKLYTYCTVHCTA